MQILIFVIITIFLLWYNENNSFFFEFRLAAGRSKGIQEFRMDLTGNSFDDSLTQFLNENQSFQESSRTSSVEDLMCLWSLPIEFFYPFPFSLSLPSRISSWTESHCVLMSDVFTNLWFTLKRARECEFYKKIGLTWQGECEKFLCKLITCMSKLSLLYW